MRGDRGEVADGYGGGGRERKKKEVLRLAVLRSPTTCSSDVKYCVSSSSFFDAASVIAAASFSSFDAAAASVVGAAFSFFDAAFVC